MNNANDSEYEAPKEPFTFIQLENLIETQNDEILKILNASPMLIHLLDDTKQTLLHIATKHNNLEVAKYLIEKGCDIDARDDFGSTPLMIAGKLDEDNIAKELVHSDADIFAVNSEGQSALEIYLNNDRDKYESALVEISNKVKSRYTNDEDIFEVLKKAQCRLRDLVGFRNVEVTKMYLIMPNYYGINGQLSIFRCMHYKYEESLLRTLLQYGVEQDIELQTRWTSFNLYFSGIMSDFLEWNDNPEINDEELQRIKMYAQIWINLGFLYCQTRDLILQLFLKSTQKTLLELLDTDLNSYVKKEFSYEPILYLFGNPNPGILEIIQRQNIDINLCGKDSETVLHIASSKNVDEYVEYLLERNLDPNARDHKGQTPIFYAFSREVSFKTYTCVTLLLKYGADIQVCDNDVKTFVEYFEYIESNAEHEQSFKLIVAHFAILQSLKLPINDSFTNFIDSHQTLRDHYKVMCEQIEKMKTHKICRSLTLFTILTQSYEFVSHRINKVELISLKSLQNLTSLHLLDYDSQYTDMICECIQLAYEIYKIREVATAVVYDSIDQLKGYHVVVDKICSYLIYSDLHRIMYPSHELNCEKCEVSMYKRKDVFCK